MNKVSKIILPVIYLSIIGIMVVSVVLVLSGVQSYLNEYPEYQYTLDGVFSDYIIPVVYTEYPEDNQVETIIRPYINGDVKISKYFYDFESDSNKQIDSLIVYEGTYMQNNGVDYGSNEDFDIVSILPGEVVSIEDNDVYGKIITIKHNDNLKSVYSNVKNVLISVGYQVSQGEIIAVSDKPKIKSDLQSILHFEIYYKDNAIDPESVYTLSVANFQ
jgi:murein DD-endopeptidase MepM/ murein hydrolase activator NlpD